MLIYNTSNTRYEYWDGSAWVEYIDGNNITTTDLGAVSQHSDVDLTGVQDGDILKRVSGSFQAISSNPPNILTVGTDASYNVDYTSVKAAVDFAATQSPAEGDEWIVKVAPGTYTENPFSLPAFVSIQAESIINGTVTLSTTNANADFITVNGNQFIHGCVIQGASGSGSRAIVNNSVTGAVGLFNCGFATCNIGSFTGVGATTVVIDNNITINGVGQTIDTIYQTTGGTLYISNLFIVVPSAVLPFYTVNPIGTAVNIDWDSGSSTPGTAVISGLIANIAPKNTNQMALQVSNGSYVSVSASEFDNNNIAMDITSAGTNTRISASGCSFVYSG